MSGGSGDAIWGISSYLRPDGVRFSYALSHEEVQRDIASATRVLRGLRVERGDLVLICSRLSEAGQWWPFTIAPMLVGARVSCADSTRADGPRLATLTRLLRYRAVLGVTGGLLDGLADVDADPAKVLGGVPVVGATPDAHARLVAAGLRPHHAIGVGPAIAIAGAPGEPARVDADEWSLDADGDRVLVTARRARATRFHRAPTAVHGTVVAPDALVPHPTGEPPP